MNIKHSFELRYLCGLPGGPKWVTGNCQVIVWGNKSVVFVKNGDDDFHEVLIFPSGRRVIEIWETIRIAIADHLGIPESDVT